MLVPIYIADECLWTPLGDRWGRYELTSFAPIPAAARPGRYAGVLYTVDFGDRPRAWVKAPALSRVVAGRLLLCGETSSARSAWVVLACARKGLGGFSLASPPAGPPPQAGPPPPPPCPAQAALRVYLGEDGWSLDGPGAGYVDVLLPPGWSPRPDGWIADTTSVPMCCEMLVANAQARRFGLAVAGSREPEPEPFALTSG